MKTLDAALLAAHAAGDGAALVRLYGQAAKDAATPDAAAFYLTQAHVFALEIGDTTAPALRQRLIAMGRESPLTAPIPPLR
tara:strand:+ start:103285 stop:103527 length:243 start_codon:yes stop_codon:yes gene_type:complete